MPRKVNVLSLFDGMGCGYLALRKCGVNVGRYVAYEIDKHCIAATTHNIKIIEHKGDVFDADFSDYRGFDFLMGGSPCTYWSIAKQDGKREKSFTGMGADMFDQYMRALEEVQPKFFIYENVASMSKDIRKAICAEFGFDPVMINSSLVSAQNRKRLYWVGVRVGNRYRPVHVEQPKDKGILLRDILDSGSTWKTKQGTIDANYYKGGTVDLLVGGHHSGNRLAVAESVGTTDDGKAYTLTANYMKCVAWNTLEKKQRTMVAVPVRVGSTPKRNGELGTSQSNRIYSVDGKGVSLQAHRTGGANGANSGLYAIPASKNTAHQVYRVRNGKIKIKGKIYPIKLSDGHYIIRKLSVRECMRLQTVPKRYDFSVVSNTQAYKMLGNGWTVSVIAHIIESIRKEVRNGRVHS